MISIYKKYKRWRMNVFIERLKKDIVRYDAMMLNAGYSRHERHRIRNYLLRKLTPVIPKRYDKPIKVR